MPAVMASLGDRRVAAILAALAAAGCGLGCGQGSTPRAVVLVTLDTLRADHVGAYGDPAGRTPTLDAWARRGVVVRDAIADVPLTLPSHVTLFTGIPALAHGVRLNEGARLLEGAVTWSERFRERGWRTGAVVSSRVLASDTGIAQGFEAYDDSVESPYEMMNPWQFPAQPHWLPPADRRADRAVTLAIAWLRGLRPRESFFLWVHLYDAHFPYDPPPPWIERDATPYGAEVRSADRALRRLSRALDVQDRRDVLMAFVADHGEGLEDHGEAEHGLFLYDETIRVPLVLSGAGVAKGFVLDAHVRTIDVGTTILEISGLPSPELGLGASLTAELNGQRPPSNRPAYSETTLPRISWSGAALKSLRTREDKYVLAPRAEWYDVAADPAERENRVPAAGGAPERHAALEEMMRDVLDRGTFHAGPGQRSDADREALRALGYMGGASPPVETPRIEDELGVNGFDAKDLVDVVLAGRDVENGFFEAADRKLTRFFDGPARRREDPVPSELFSLAHQNRAAIAMARGQFAAAAESYKAALRAESANLDARSGLVFALNLAGRPRDAEREAARLLIETPVAPKLRLHRGLSLLLLGRGRDARQELERVSAEARDPEEVKVARDFAARIGTAEERSWLDAYLASAVVAGAAD